MGDEPIFGEAYQAAERAGEIVEIIPTPFVWRDPATIPLRPWVLGRWLLRGTVATVVAPGGVGKSSLMAGVVMSLATGQPLLGKTVWGGTKRVWYWNLEDDQDELDRQAIAAALHYRLGPDHFGDRIWIDSGVTGQGLCVATEGPDGFKIIEPVLNAIVEALLLRSIDVLIIDPFVSSHGLDENSNSKIDAVSKAWVRVAIRANSVIILVHHTRKPSGQKVTAELSRGAVSLPYAARTALVLNRMDADEAKRFGIKEEDRRRYLSVGDDKHNRAPAEKADWFRFHSVDLGNATSLLPADSVGVLAPWTPPDPFEGLTGNHLYRVQLAISEGKWRESSQVTDGTWVGVAVAQVLGLDLEETADLARAKALLRQWIKEGVLVVKHHPDSNHEPRPYVEVGRWQTDSSPPRPAP